MKDKKIHDISVWFSSGSTTFYSTLSLGVLWPAGVNLPPFGSPFSKLFTTLNIVDLSRTHSRWKPA